MLAAGLLAGDLAIASAFALVASAPADRAALLRVVGLLAEGIETTVVGELLDVTASLSSPRDVDALAVAELKTAAYSGSLPLVVGAVLAGADDAQVARLGAVGSALGVAFQLADDDLGVFGDPAVTGKSVLSDLREGKRTELLRRAYAMADDAGCAVLDAHVGRADLDDAGAAAVRRRPGVQRGAGRGAGADPGHRAARAASWRWTGCRSRWEATLWASSTILSDGVTEVLGESMSDLRTARDRALRLYDATAARTSAGVLAAYSTSFGLGTRLLGRRAQEDIRAVYALVRLADEVVDTYRGDDAGAELDELEEQTARALRTGYSTNLVVHAFARTARRVGISAAETAPFFASMRADLTVREHDRASYERLRLRLGRGGRPDVRARVPQRGPAARRAGAGARRGAGDAVPGRSARRSRRSTSCATSAPTPRSWAAPTSRAPTPGHLDDAQLDAILREITDDVAAARAAVPSLPRRARYAVGATLALYQRLLDEIASRPPEELLVGRVRLPTPVKLLVRAAESVLAEARAGRADGAGRAGAA